MVQSAKRRRQPLKENDGHSCTGEEKKVIIILDGYRLTTPGRIYQNIELKADMTENRHDWKTMVKTGPQRCGDSL